MSKNTMLGFNGSVIHPVEKKDEALSELDIAKLREQGYKEIDAEGKEVVALDTEDQDSSGTNTDGVETITVEEHNKFVEERKLEAESMMKYVKDLEANIIELQKHIKDKVETIVSLEEQLKETEANPEETATETKETEANPEETAKAEEQLAAEKDKKAKGKK